jgi:hypothetical protein
MKQINDGNFGVFAAKFYDNPDCLDMLEFQDDINRIKYIKRLFRKYHDSGVLKERLIINHLVVLYNVFDHEACTKMLTFKLINYLPYLKPFLEFLNYWPNQIEGLGIEDVVLKSEEVESDEIIVQALGKI